MNKENLRYRFDPESGNEYLIFTPADLDEDSNLLPPSILFPLELGLEVHVLDSDNLEYIAPRSTSDEDIIKIEKQLEEKFKKHKEFLNSLKPY